MVDQHGTFLSIWLAGIIGRQASVPIILTFQSHVLWQSGWWLSPTPLKNMSSSAGMMILDVWKTKMFQTTNQLSVR
jgi:hypothetical protein